VFRWIEFALPSSCLIRSLGSKSRITARKNTSVNVKFQSICVKFARGWK
jgi:hypothetical protein